MSLSACLGWDYVSWFQLSHLESKQAKATNMSTFFLTRGYVKPKQGLVKFAVRLKGKNVEVRIATSLKNVKERNEEADGMSDIQ